MTGTERRAIRNVLDTYNLFGCATADVVGHWYPAASLNLYP